MAEIDAFLKKGLDLAICEYLLAKELERNTTPRPAIREPLIKALATARLS